MEKIRPFDLEAAKAGAPVCTRDGRPARIICTDCRDKDFPIVALVTDDVGVENPCTYTAGGNIYADGHPADGDLRMQVRTRTGWINIYPHKEERWMMGLIFATEEEAKADAGKKAAATVKIEWEE